MRFCTAICRNALAHARVLGDSLAKHHPSAEFAVLIVDDPDEQLGTHEDFATLRPRDIGLEEPEFLRAAALYPAQALVSSLKGRLLRHLLKHDTSPVLLLDADICVYAELDSLAKLAREHEIVLSPHSLEPIPTQANVSADNAFIRAGVFNGGFLGVGPGSEPFLDWWADRVELDCVFDIRRNLHLSQSWLALVPALFQHHVLRDPGCNVMGHNLLNRDIRFAADGRVEIEGVPLRFFHFTGFDPGTGDWKAFFPGLYWWPSLQARPGTARLCREYEAQLAARGYATYARLVPTYDLLPDGRPFEAAMRWAYRDALLEACRTGDAAPPNPFADGVSPFLSWLNKPALAHQPSGPTRLEVASSAAAGAAAFGLLS